MSRTAAQLAQARRLITADPSAAVALLRRCLARRNPYTAPADTSTRDLAELYVRLTSNTRAETATIGWAAYLRRATLNQYGEADTRTHDTGRLLIELAQRRATPAALVDLRGLTTSRTDGGCQAGRAVAARFQVVALLHTCGLCEQAEREAFAALSQWTPHHHEAPDVTYTYLVKTLTVLDHCGRTRQGRSVLHAYGAFLPEADTDAHTFLRSYATLKLGNHRQIQRHQNVCGNRRPRPRSCYHDLRAAILHALAHEHLPHPTAIARARPAS